VSLSSKKRHALVRWGVPMYLEKGTERVPRRGGYRRGTLPGHRLGRERRSLSTTTPSGRSRAAPRLEVSRKPVGTPALRSPASPANSSHTRAASEINDGRGGRPLPPDAARPPTGRAPPQRRPTPPARTRHRHPRSRRHRVATRQRVTGWPRGHSPGERRWPPASRWPPTGEWPASRLTLGPATPDGYRHPPDLSVWPLMAA
jgi:hypothetical protein